MTDKKLTLRALAFALACLMLFPCMPVVANADSTPQTVTTTLDLAEDKLFVFDLSMGSVTIGSTFSGQGYVKNGNTWSIGTLKGNHDDGNKYYIFQSGIKTVNLDGNTLTLTATDIDNSLMINKTVVHDPVNNTGVVQTWAAAATGRTSTANYIVIGNGNTAKGGTFDVTIDDIWSTHRINSDSYAQDKGMGGIDVYSANSQNFNVTIRLKGDNRLEHLFYSNSQGNSSLTITDGASDGAPVGSLTVIAEQEISEKVKDHGTYYKGKVTFNHWRSVIGGSDSIEDVCNLNFTGGVVYAGASEKENCTAIGGGGNGHGKITISDDAVVTAVTHSTGTAIGGGIAHTANGGTADITISGGTVYAYNFGVFALDRVPRTSDGYGTSDSKQMDMARHVPGTAIGGAGSIRSTGSDGIVKISGGTVVAQSLGGTAIGGGSTVGLANNGVGGEAEVTIEGGNVRAESIGATLISTVDNGTGTFFVAKGTSHTVNPGTAIGGGSSIAKTGGEATVKITGGNIYATGIGGGGSTYDVGGDANVSMNGGTVVSSGIGGGFSQTYGYANGTVKIDGGSLNSAMAAAPVNTADEPVQLTRVSLFYGDSSVNKDKITKLVLQKLGAGYTIKDMYTDENGMIYLWIPEDDGVTLATVASKGELINFTPNDEPDRIVNANDVGALIYDSNVPRYIVTIAGSSYYSLFQDSAKTSPFYGSLIVEGGLFTYYLSKDQDCTLTPYIGGVSPEGDKIIQPNANFLIPVEGQSNLYMGTTFVQSNVTIWYEIEVGGEKFFAIDLSAGDVTITEQADGSLTITQAGYTLSGYKGKIYLTSAGYPTANTVTVHSEAGDNSDVSIHADELTVVSDGPALSVESGFVNLTFGAEDNLMHSVNGAPIYVGDGGTHGAKLNLAVDGKDSIKLNTSAADSPIIMGPGTLDLNNGGGFLNIGKVGDATSQIAVGEFILTGNNDKYTAELYRGKYSYNVVGYVQNNVLYPPDTNTQGKSFAARGIHEIYKDVKSTVTFDKARNVLVVQLDVTDSTKNMGYYKVTLPGGGDITSSVLKSEEAKRVILEINGAAFLEGNLTITAAIAGEIPYDIQGSADDGVYVYDAKPHTITAMLDTSLFEVFYSTEKIESSTVLTASMKEEIPYTNVGTYRVYYHIREREGLANSVEYNAVYGYADLQITPGENQWILDLECADIICGSAPAPSAKSKWGTVEYTFYLDGGTVGEPDDTPTQISDFSAIDADTNFYVIARVAADGTNYPEMVSNPVYFRALKLDAYATRGRQLDRMTSGVTGALEIANRDVFSVYYKGQSAGEASVLTFGNTLPAGTKITMIELSGGTAKYYYYVLATDSTSVYLTNFIPMGILGAAGTTYEPPTGEAVEYQFCFEYSNLPGTAVEFNMVLNGAGGVPLAHRLSITEQLEAIENALTETKLDVVGGYETIEITVNPNVNGSGHKYLAFRIRGTVKTPGSTDPAKDFALVNVESALAISATVDNGATTQILSPVASTNDLLVFYLGGAQVSVNQQYTLVLNNVEAGDYYLTVEADVRLFEQALKDYYVLGGQMDGVNHTVRSYTDDAGENKFISVASRTHFYVCPEYPADQLVTGSQQVLTFQVVMSPAPDQAPAAPRMGVRLYMKNINGRYDLLTSLGQNGLVIMEVQNNRITVNVASLEALMNNTPIANGTYRIEFIYEGRSCFCNIVVAK